jgi:Uma2 family endonuclease
MNDDIIDPVNPTPFPPEPTITPSGDLYGNLPHQIPPEVVPNLDDLVIEDNEPVESFFAEKQYRLLTEPLYVSWNPPDQSFMAVANVGLYYAAKQPPLVPDVMLSLNVPVEKDLSRKENRSYFMWIVGKPPDVVMEFVSDRRGGEEDYKKDEYARIGVTYYVIFDPQERLRGGVLRAFALRERVYQSIEAAWLPGVGLGLKLWGGEFEGKAATWLRWCDREGVVIPTGGERAEQERQRAEQERQRAERLAAQLRALGIEPNP